MPLRICLLAFSFLSISVRAGAETGVSENKIVIGLSTNLTGPSNERPKEAMRGFDLYFEKINSHGGVFGRKIETIVYDDSYQPDKSLNNCKKLAEVDKVFALFSVYGAAASKAVLPYVSTHGIPFLFPSSGASSLREPVVKNVFNLRLGYASEADAIIKYFVKKRGFKNIGVVYQDDSVGQEGKSGAQKALARLGLSLKADAAFRRDGKDAAQAFEALRKKQLDAILIASAAAPAAEFVKKVRENKLPWVMAGVTVIGSAEFLSKAGSAAEGVLVAQSFPPLDSSSEFVKQFKADIQSAGVTQTVGIEGYANAVVFVEALNKAGKELTRDKLLNAFEEMKDINLAGLKIKFSSDDHEGLDTLYLLRVEGGKYISAD